MAREALGLRLKGFGFGAKSEPLEPGRRSWGGDAVKHSSKVNAEVELEVELDMLGKVSTPAPNLKAGSGLFSCCLKDTVLVE